MSEEKKPESSDGSAPAETPTAAPGSPVAGSVACGCAVGRQLAPEALRELDDALSGRSAYADSLKKLGLRFGIPKATVAAHKYKCLGIAGGERTLVDDPINGVINAPKYANKRAVNDTDRSVSSERGTAGKSADSGATPPATDRPVNYLARAKANLADTRDKRIAYLAERLANDKDRGFITYAHLADIWELSIAEVRDLADAAHLMYQACRGDTSHERRRSVATSDTVKKRAERVFREAMNGIDSVTGVAAPDVKAAAAALSVMQKAQANQDRATGVTAGGTLGAMFRTPEFQLLLRVTLDALRAYPDARVAVVTAMRRELDARRVGPAFDDAVRLLEGRDDSA